MKRKHAALIRITAGERNDEELTLTLAYADRLEAEAELDDALAGVEPTMADHADVEQVVPVLEVAHRFPASPPSDPGRHECSLEEAPVALTASLSLAAALSNTSFENSNCSRSK